MRWSILSPFALLSVPEVFHQHQAAVEHLLECYPKHSNWTFGSFSSSFLPGPPHGFLDRACLFLHYYRKGPGSWAGRPLHNLKLCILSNNSCIYRFLQDMKDYGNIHKEKLFRGQNKVILLIHVNAFSWHTTANEQNI